MKILVTGAAGFIGSAVSQKLLDRGDTVVGLVRLWHPPDTNADVEAPRIDAGYQPTTPVEVGIKNLLNGTASIILCS